MKGKLTAIIAGTMLAITGAILPASALVSSTVSQQPVNGKPETLLLAAKKKENPVKGGHSTGKSPSNQEKHEAGEARRNQDQNINPAWKDYKKKGGTLSKDAWLKQGQPKK